ncbi:MAG: hypothetical protein ACQKBV_06025, partial [Puniceicoccales bacterium]
MLKTTYILLTSALLASASASAQVVVNSVSDLTFDYTGAASQISNSGGTLSFSSSKNTFATAALPNTYELGINDTISTTFTFQVSDTVVDTQSTFEIRFSDGVNFYDARLNPAVTASGLTFGETTDNNLGKFNLDNT